jgi:lambda repressor-like predicted transcriptional regulator
MAVNVSHSVRIADRVEAAMKARGVTLYQLASRSAIPRTTLGHCLAGTAGFKVEHLFRIGEVLGFQPSELLADVEKEIAA